MTVQDRIDGYWNRRAPSYDAAQHRPEHGGRDREIWREVWRSALPAAPVDVLDVGTGSGQVATILAELGHRVTGLDSAEAMLAIARTHGAAMTAPPRFVQGDAVAPDFADDSFDVIACRYVMWTLREPERALASWRRLLRPGGRLALVDSTWFPHGLQGHGNDAFTTSYDGEVRDALPLAEATSIESTAAVLETAGFTDVRVEPLETVLELDRECGAAPGHEVQLQYLLTARP